MFLQVQLSDRAHALYALGPCFNQAEELEKT